MTQPDEPQPRIADETRAADRRDARKEASADRPPTPDEEASAEEQGDVRPETAEAYEEMSRLGAEHPGEGRIEG